METTMDIIKQSLLAPDYIRESNSFIMEYNFIENQIAFPKNNFFQIGNKPEESTPTGTTFSEVSPSTQLQTTINESPRIDLKHSNNILPLEEGYGKPFNLPHTNSIEPCNREVINSVESYSSLSLLAPTNVINEPISSEDVISFRFARKALPHKKRISRKLKSISNEDQEKRLQFTCEICGHCVDSQLQFFSHLKEHYEPTSPQIIDSLRTNLDNIDAEKTCANVHNMHQLNFSDFPSDVNSVSISKCIGFESGDEASLKNMVDEEIEFSDTEDMLEGIRNVVEKIEDSSTIHDEIENISANDLRGHWFNDDNYQRIETSTLKTDVTFSGSFGQILDTDDVPPEEADVVSKFESSVKEIGAQNLIDFSNLCSEKLESNKNIHQSNLLTSSCQEKTTTSCVDDSLSSIEDLGCQVFNNEGNIKSSRTKGKNYYCEVCKRDFNSGNALKYHNRRHTGIRPYKCKICERSFFAQGALKSHMRTHTGEKPFQCEFCQQRFRQWGDLKYHTTSLHTEEKSHQCEFCGKAFSRKYSLNLHLRIHRNIRNYKCEFCEKAFRASTYLQNHRRIHTGEKPHECKVFECRKRFRVFGDLRRHMRIHQRNAEGEENSKMQDLNKGSK